MSSAFSLFMAWGGFAINLRSFEEEKNEALREREGLYN